MKIIMLVIILGLTAIDVNADITASYASGKPTQISTGVQPNDKPTKYIDMNVGMAATSDTIGLSIVTGYEFTCSDDPDVNPNQLQDFTDNKRFLSLYFGTDSPDNFHNWDANILDTRACKIIWTASALATTTTTGDTLTFEIMGMFATIGFNIASSQTQSAKIKGKKDSSIFSMYKEPDCRN